MIRCSEDLPDIKRERFYTDGVLERPQYEVEALMFEGFFLYLRRLCSENTRSGGTKEFALTSFENCFLSANWIPGSSRTGP